MNWATTLEAKKNGVKIDKKSMLLKNSVQYTQSIQIMPEKMSGINYGAHYIVSSKSKDFDENKDEKLLDKIDKSRRILTAVDGFKVGETKMRPQILNFRL